MFQTVFMKYGVLAQHSDIYGQALDKDVFISKLSHLDIKIAIAVISRLISLHWAINREEKDAKVLFDIIRTAHGCRIALEGGNNVPYFKSGTICYPQTLYVLLKWILVYGKDKEEPLRAISLEDILHILDLSLVVNDFLPGDDVAGNETDYLNVNLYHNTAHLPLSQIGRTYYIYNEIMRGMDRAKTYIDTFEEKNGFSLSQFFAESFNLLSFSFCSKWDIAGFCTSAFAFDNTNPDVKLLQPIHEQFIKSTVVSYSKARDMATKTLEDTWDFEVFFRYPLIAFDNLIFCVSEATSIYLIGEGLYWRIRFQDGDEIGKKFMNVYGKAFESYVQFATQYILTDVEANFPYLSEFDYCYCNQPRKSTDVYIRLGRSLLAIEVKAESPHSSVLKGYNTEQLHAEVEALIVSPVKQTDRRLQELLADDMDWSGNEHAQKFFDEVENIYVLCVSRESIQPVGELLYYADEKLKSNDEYGDAIKTDKISGYFNLNVTDYEALLKLIQNGVDVSQLLSDWFRAGRTEKRIVIPFCSFVTSCGFEYRCPNKLEELFKEELDQLRIVTFGNS